MRYLPHTDEEISEMLAVTGHESLDSLFSHIPPACRYEGDIKIPAQLSEWALTERLESLGNKMAARNARAVLVGAGSYHHHQPEMVKSLMSRSEFLTAYTPYQPEMAQGTLQGIFEFQTLTARLLGMEVANASMYDGASALAEALLMSLRLKKKKKKVAISRAVHPHYREVVKTYLEPGPFELVELPFDETGRTDLSGLGDIDELAGVAVQSPNFFGIVEDLETCAQKIHEAEAIFVSCFTEPFSYGLLKNPGTCGADIVCGEGQSFGLGQSYGGPGLGLFASRNEFLRSMPGRLVGQTVDADGQRGFVLTLSTREQHIRREKATSNICSNQGICAMTAAAYMASLGGSGIRKVARQNYDKANYFRQVMIEAGARPVFDSPIFNEFVLSFESDFAPVRETLAAKGIIAGLDISCFYPEMKNAYLFCATESVHRQILDEIAAEVAQ